MKTRILFIFLLMERGLTTLPWLACVDSRKTTGFRLQSAGIEGPYGWLAWGVAYT